MTHPNAISFRCAGIPVAKGSATAYVIRGTNRAVVSQTNLKKQKPWSSLITMEAQAAGVKIAESGPVFVDMHFYFPRPKKHYRGKAMTLREDAPKLHCNTPDVDKLVRLVFDSLTGIAWLDDKQAHIGYAIKQYGAEPGALITIRRGL